MSFLIYMAMYLATYKLALDLPQVLRADRPSDVFGISTRGTLSILRWRVLLIALVLGLITAYLLHGGS